MKTKRKFEHVFSSTVPDVLEKEKLYVSIKYNTSVHLCACGCGEEVITPLAPNQWKLTYNGETVSLHPSIGNWSYKCRSHYWIKEDHVVWAESWSDEQIKRNRMLEERVKESKKEMRKVKDKKSFADFIKWLFK
jgi:hypothetical protein